MDDYSNWETKILNSYTHGEWKEILELGKQKFATEIETSKQRLISWTWLHLADLRYIAEATKAHGATDGLLSIGCGTGLLEWILQASTNIPVSGLEIDSGWWNSKHAPKPFIPLHFADEGIDTALLKDLIPNNNKEFNSNCCDSYSYRCLYPETKCNDSLSTFGLLFCYFNNRSAFDEYVSIFQGPLIIIIGPVEGQGIYTEPSPILPKFNTNIWKLCSQKITEDKKNIIAIYCVRS